MLQPLLQMAAFCPLLTVTAAVLLCGALTGEVAFSTGEHAHALDFIATLLCKTLTDAQEVIRNFQVASRNSTHITFSWDIVDGYYSSSDINYFYFYYIQRSGSSGYSNSIYITYSSSDLIKFGASFKYTRAVTAFPAYGQYVMSVYVYRSSLTPTGVYSDEIYVEVGK